MREDTMPEAVAQQVTEATAAARQVGVDLALVAGYLEGPVDPAVVALKGGVVLVPVLGDLPEHARVFFVPCDGEPGDVRRLIAERLVGEVVLANLPAVLWASRGQIIGAGAEALLGGAA